MTDFIDQLELSTRALKRLRNAGVTTRDQFMAVTKEQIMGWPHAGVGTVREIKHMQEIISPSPEKREADKENALIGMVREINAILDGSPHLGIRVQDGRLQTFKVLA